METKLEAMRDKGMSDETLGFIEFALFTPDCDYGMRVKDSASADAGRLVWDPVRDVVHKLARETESRELAHFLSDCGGLFLDLEQNMNTRMVAVIFMACPSGEPPKTCAECLPDMPANIEIDMGIKTA